VGQDRGALRLHPGFIVNRVARPFYGEAQRMLEEGVGDCASIDAALRAAGFRLGPFELADLIGNDVNLASTESVWQQTGHDPRYEPTAAQRSLVAAGRLGRKSGVGWYDYADGEPVRLADPAVGSRATQVGADNDAIAVRVIALLRRRGRRPRRPGGGQCRGRRHRHAAGHELPVRAAGVG
jgi:3-hydroxybutyryl-CoA dehydrogenase